MTTLPQVEVVCSSGLRLKDLSEVEDEKKDAFAEHVDDIRNQWLKLQQSIEALCIKYSQAASRTKKFQEDHLNPLLAWVTGVEPILSSQYPIGGDAGALAELQEKFDVSG